MSHTLAARIELLRAEKENYSFATLQRTYDVNRYYLWCMLHKDDYSPPDWVRQRLGIESRSAVEVISGTIPPGSQAISAQQCECGQWFVSNHPRRRRCFLCSPYRGRR